MNKATAHSSIQKYLDTYAEPYPAMEDLPRTYDHVLVIPAFAERPESVQRVWQKIEANFLVILVINAPRQHDKTLELLAFFKRYYRTVYAGPHWFICEKPDQPNLLILDHCSPGRYLPEKQGVGLARKIGADLALRLIQTGQIKTPRIYCSDADARLPKPYFSTQSSSSYASTCASKPAGWIYNYRHRLSKNTASRKAMMLYELTLRHYEAGLIWAGSDYGHASLGSLMVIDAHAYAQVRGVPKRSTGEDFYLLNKLAKVGPLTSLNQITIELSSRCSTRVPIGTGTGVRGLLACDPSRDQIFYNPSLFHSLREALTSMKQCQSVSELTSADSRPLIDFLKISRRLESLENIERNSSSQDHFKRALNHWFDGFQQLKYLHFLRDQGAANVTLSTVLSAPWLDSNVIKTRRREALLALL
ncbi:MAG: hypothetical protein ACPHUJ_02855 [Pseudomonadales bacterium]